MEKLNEAIKPTGELGKIPIDVKVKYPRLGKVVDEIWTFIVHGGKVVALLRNDQWYRSFEVDDSRALFFSQVNLGKEERVEFMVDESNSGLYITGDIRTNTTQWYFDDWVIKVDKLLIDLGDWEVNSMFRVIKVDK